MSWGLLETAVESVVFVSGVTMFGVGVALATDDGRDGEGALSLIVLGAVMIQVSSLL